MTTCKKMSRPRAGSIGSALLMMLTPLVSACVIASPAAICEGTASATDAHTAALLADGGPLSLVTGDLLIAQLDAGCAR